ncbi:MAG: 4Fe-4S dicluster domain-containing protein [Bacteroidetes bacterium]|nr:4Fe-4S dicluster domain-containing protein [Bacteroidota bacterium]MCL5738648.1 4Fe-4S dicluster domain-containing protein [Bacteroidota bacterium]
MDTTLKLKINNLPQLFAALQSRGYTTVGPTLRDEAIVYDRIDSADELPIGWTDEQAPATYRLKKRDDNAYFGFNATPQSWKRYLYPPQRKLFSIKKNGKSLELLEEKDSNVKYAFIGVRSCELNAIMVQDKVFNSNEYKDDSYNSIRKNLFIAAVNCTQAGETCFCVSMKTGPKARSSFDLALTEVLTENEHYFVVEIGSENGASIMAQVDAAAVNENEIEEADKIIRQTESTMKRSMETADLPELLSENLEHPHWDEVAKRCLTCGNCTMVCPTCFCSTVEDVTDLAGQNAERFRRWDSCFTMDFSKVAGGSFRISPKSRYRQWLTHKLSSWVEQFGTSGCVGCGRCITWCPVGIDITAEVQAIRGVETQSEGSFGQQKGV